MAVTPSSKPSERLRLSGVDFLPWAKVACTGWQRKAVHLAKVMPEIVPPEYWQRRATLTLARNLLGKYLVRARGDARMITEVEAYDGERDLACHARAGRTTRTAVMYGPGGVWYVYLCYGIHEMLNLVVGPADWPAAVLIRGVEGCRGPGRVTRTLGIDRKFNGTRSHPDLGLWLEDRGIKVPRRIIRATPRIGVGYAGPVWAKKPWRFHFDPADLPASARTQSATASEARRARRAAGN
jgi:DNA-3-methyladenine glycosylase